MAHSVGGQGVEFTSAFGKVAEVHGRTASAAFDAFDPKRKWSVHRSSRGLADGLLDHLVGEREQRRRHSDAEHPGGLGIDDELALGLLYNRQVRRLSALENAAGICAELTIRSRNVGSVVVAAAAGLTRTATRAAVGTITVCAGSRISDRSRGVRRDRRMARCAANASHAANSRYAGTNSNITRTDPRHASTNSDHAACKCPAVAGARAILETEGRFQ